MKKLIWLAFISLISLSCNKETNIEQQSNQPVLIKVEANHTTGQIVSSEVIFIK